MAHEDYTTMTVKGMTCGGCEKSVVATASSVAGVTSVTADRHQNEARISWDASLAPAAKAQALVDVCAAIEAAGFDCSPLKA